MTEINLGITKRNSYLDLLRGLAIISVVITHVESFSNSVSRLAGSNNSLLNYIASLGKYGVELFFVISGFLLASIYSGQSRFSHIQYFARRMARIYPLWIAFLAIAYLVSHFQITGSISRLEFTPEGNSGWLANWPIVVLATMTFTLWTSATLWNSVIPGGWSIQAEVGHYLLFPLIRNKSVSAILKVCLIVNLFTCITYAILPGLEMIPKPLTLAIESWIRLGLYSTFGYFFLGIIASRLIANISQLGDFRNALNVTLPNLSLFTAWLLSFLLVPISFGSQTEALGFITTLIICSFGLQRVRIISKLLLILGKYSYFIYFSHFIVLDFMREIFQEGDISLIFPGSQLICFVLALICTLIITCTLATISFKYFETPFISYSHRFNTKRAN